MSHKEKDAESQKIVRIARYCALGVIIVWALTFLLFFMSDSEKRGQFGDMFGAVNALFSGLAFAGLIITLILQRRELSLQRDELEQTREELKNQREEFEKENETLRQQRFENLFYNMLNLQQEIVAGLRFEYDEEQIVTVPIGPDNSPVQDKRKIVKYSMSGNADDLEIKFGTRTGIPAQRATEYENYFHVEKLYGNLKDTVEEVIWKYRVYNKAGRQALKDSYEHLLPHESDWNRFVLGKL